MTFIDSLTSPLTLVSPENNVADLETTALNLKWQTNSAATMYEWQMSDNTGFTGLSAGLTDTTDASSVRATGLNSAVAYYWRVRISKPMLSRWSDTRSFNTKLGVANTAPSLAIPAAAQKPRSGRFSSGRPSTLPIITNLLVAKDADFAKPVIDKTGNNAISANAWEADISLENETTYYWKVKARNDISFGTWSAVSSFVTEAPVLTTAPPENSPVLAAQPAVIQTPAPQTQTQTQTQIVSTIQTQSDNTPQAININLNIPPLIMYGGILLLAAIVIMLALLVVNSARHKY
jgi:hypothetical protein